jgi:predicted permease
MSISEFRYALRSFRKNVGHSLTSVLILAIGIGACTAVFSVLEAVLLNPPPYPNAGRISMLWIRARPDMRLGFSELPLHGLQFNFLNARRQGFQAISAFKADEFNLTWSDSVQRIDGTRASADFFRVLGVRPILGRTFTSDDDQPGREHEVVLSHGLWKQSFGADREIVGREILLNNEKYTVIGVMPAGFSFPHGAELPRSFALPAESQLWVPLALPSNYRGVSDLLGIACARPGVSRAQITSELKQLQRSFEDQDPRWKSWSDFVTVPLQTQISGDLGPKIVLLFGSVLAVLLITCANVANLFLAKSMGRAKEIAVRIALGARQVELLRQFLVEGAVLGIVGSTVGFGLAAISVQVLKTMHLPVPRLSEATLDVRTVLFAVLLAMGSTVLFSIFPAFEMSRRQNFEVLRTKEQKGSSAAARRFRNGLLIGEVALTVTLVVTATLLVRSFVHLISVTPGFNAAHLLTFEVTLPAARYRTYDDISKVYTRLLNRLSSVNGVDAVGLGKALPLTAGTHESTVYYINDLQVDKNNYPIAEYTIASPEYFRSMGISLLAGRSFTGGDDANSHKVVIISKSLAHLYWNNTALALGHMMSLPNPRWKDMTIIGIVDDVKNYSLDENSGPNMYVPYSQSPYPSMQTMGFAARSSLPPQETASALQEAVREVDSELPIANIHSMQELVTDSTASVRFSVMLLSLFAGVAWTLALIGIFAIVSYLVNERMHEMGVRLALGAQRRDLLSLVFATGMRFISIGIAAGIILLLALSRVLGHYLYHVRSIDPLTYITIGLVVLIAGSLAILIPARQVMKVDPIAVLHAE